MSFILAAPGAVTVVAVVAFAVASFVAAALFCFELPFAFCIVQPG